MIIFSFINYNYTVTSRYAVVIQKSLNLSCLLGEMQPIERLGEAGIGHEKLVENCLVGVYIIQDGVFKYVNPEFSRIFGYSRSELIGMRYTELIAKGDLKKLSKGVCERRLGKGKPIRYEIRGVRKDGTIIDLEVFSVPTVFEGRPAVQGTVLDITERKKLIKELKKERKKFEIICQSIEDPLYLIGKNFDIKYANQKFKEEFNLKRDKKCYKVIYKRKSPCKFCPLHRVLKHRKSIKYETTANSKCYECVSSFVYYNSSPAMLTLMRDITERKEMEEKLRKSKLAFFNMLKDLHEAYEKLKKAYEMVREADKVKGDILANVSHELKTPLTIALGLIDLSLEEEKNENIKEFLERAKKALKRQQVLIDNLINLSRIEKGEFKLKFSFIRLDKLIEECIDELSEKAGKKHVKISVECPPIDVNVDRIELKHVIVNLLDNAIKFNREGGEVTVKVREKGKEVEVCIEDTGIGIEKKYLRKIFEPFFQVDMSARRRYGGAGLGLTIVKRILDLHRGKITVETSPGKGSKFCFSVPILGDLDV